MAIEKRLIDANALIDEWNTKIKKMRKDSDGAYPVDFAIVISAVSKAPTVDAVDTADFDEILYKLECLLCHATGGKYSKAGYALEDMYRMVTDYIERCCDEAVAEEVVHGRWIHDINNLYGCSECGKRETMSPKKLKNYCPNCGAKMDGERKDNEV